MKWAQRIVFSLLICLLFGIGGLMVYDLTCTKQVTVRVDIEQGADPFETIPKIVSNGGRIISVRQADDNTYEIKVVTRKTKQGFLDWLLQSDKVKNAELKEND